MQRVACQCCISGGADCGQHHGANKGLCSPCVVHSLLLSLGLTRCYCSSSPASENAASVLPTDEPQTTLVAEAVPVLDPQTTLNALRVLSLQGRELPHTTELPQTTEVLATLALPLAIETVSVCGLKTTLGDSAAPTFDGARSV